MCHLASDIIDTEYNGNLFVKVTGCTSICTNSMLISFNRGGHLVALLVGRTLE